MKSEQMALVPRERIVRAIHVFREERVMLDATLAELYGVETRASIQAVKRNLDRFPRDFMFQLTQRETVRSRSQSVMSNTRGGRRTRPYVFTEQGVAMLSSVLHSQRAVEVDVEIMRTFVQLRQMFAGHADLVRRLDALEQRYDKQFRAVFDAIRALITEKTSQQRRIGFGTNWTSPSSGERSLRNAPAIAVRT